MQNISAHFPCIISLCHCPPYPLLSFPSLSCCKISFKEFNDSKFYSINSLCKFTIHLSFCKIHFESTIQVTIHTIHISITIH